MSKAITIIAAWSTVSVLSIACVSATKSFLYKSAEIFYPAGAPDDPATLPDLTPAQRRVLERTITSAMDDLWRVHLRHGKVLSQVFDRPVDRSVRPTLELTGAKQTQAEIDVTGRVTLDAKVVQALFRAALVAGFEVDIFLQRLKTESSSEETPIGSADDQRIALQTFFDLKQRIDNGERPGAFGDFGDAASRGVSGPGTFPVDWARKNTNTEAFYRHQLLFLLAHELGHLALTHLPLIQKGDSCDASRRRETEADIYASTLLAIATKQLASVDMLGIFAREPPASSGFEEFFRRAYIYSEFGLDGTAACLYPSPEMRLNAVTAVYSRIRSQQLQ